MGWAIASSPESAEIEPAGTAQEFVLIQYDAEHIALRRYLGMLGLDQDTAQDVVHDCFVKLYHHVAASGDRSNIRAWLYRTAHNQARNRQLRKDARHRPIDGLAAEPVAATLTPEQRLIAVEREQGIAEGMRRLSGVQRECLALRAQGLKYREIAEVLGLATSTVAEHVQRALEMLKKWV